MTFSSESIFTLNGFRAFSNFNFKSSIGSLYPTSITLSSLFTLYFSLKIPITSSYFAVSALVFSNSSPCFSSFNELKFCILLSVRAFIPSSESSFKYIILSITILNSFSFSHSSSLNG